MKYFKEEVFKDFSKYIQKLEEYKYYFICLELKLEKELMLIRIKNNSSICEEEKKRIYSRIQNASRFKTIEEVFSAGLDQSEGGGFGLIIAVLMLRRLGLDEKFLEFSFEPEATNVTLKIPLNLLTKEELEIFANEILVEIERMPYLPENLTKLINQIQDPNADFYKVAEIIRKDALITSEVLRVANSPVYMLPKKVDDVLVAVKLIGFIGLRNLLLFEGVKQIITSNYPNDKIEEVLKHSYQVALLASGIARLKKMEALIEDIYVAGLIHDIGKIITLSLNPELVKKIKVIAEQKNIPLTSIEELSKGYNHASLGARFAIKWNFPEKFVQCLNYHHLPLEADEDYRALIYTIYLANKLYYFFNNERKYYEISHSVLNYFNLNDELNFNDFVNKLKGIWEESKKI